ncbi:MAG: hypothetical protein HZC28_01165 [Spirochaetes bacterium]|nr:hypothetical protein [Spirochaetota bacterium]
MFRTLVIIFSAMIFSVSLATAQVQTPAIAATFKVYPLDSKTLRNDIEEFMKEGYSPVGIEVIESGAYEGIYVLFDVDPDKEIKDWRIITYKSTNEAIKGIDAELKKGWIPGDMAWGQRLNYVLYQRFAEKVTEWKLENVKGPRAFDALLEKYAEKDYLPMGFNWNSVTGEVSVFFLKWPKLEIEEYDITTYNNINELEADLTKKARDGWSPCGFMIANGKFRVFILR